MDLGPLHFRALRASLAQLPSTGLAGSAGALEQAHDLKLQLDKARPTFSRLLEKLPSNPKEREELEKGRLLPYGASGIKAVNQEFRLEALFLSSQLLISERLAGTILLAVLNDHRPRPGRPTAENAVILYYEERRDLLLCLEMLFSYMSDGDLFSSLDANIANVVASFVNDTVASEDPKDGTWVKRMLKQMDNQQKEVDDIRNGKVPAPVASTSGPQARFNEDIQGLRIQAHQEERRLLATIVYHASATNLLSKSDVLALSRWTATLKAPQTDPTLPVCLASLLRILDAGTPASMDLFIDDSKFVSDLHSFITTKVNWKASQASDFSPIQPLVQLAWCLFLINIFRYRSDLMTETRISENTIEDGIIDALQSSALDFCGNSLLRFKKPVDPFEEFGWSAGTREDPSSGHQCADVDLSFEPIVLERVDSLVESFIVNASSILRKVRHREEDILLANSLGRPSGTPNRRRALSGSRRGSEAPSQAPVGAHEQRHDIEALFALIATLYRDSSDAGLKFWIEENDNDAEAQHRHSRLSSFLRWAADCRVQSMQRAFFEMLGSLASGPRSAASAFEFLAQAGAEGYSANSLCSWSSLFDALQFYASHKASEGPTEIPPDEVNLLKSFLRLLKIVVEHSPLARASLYDNQRYKPVTTIFGLIVQPIPIDFKATLLDAVAAFLTPALTDDGAGMVGLPTEIAKRTWHILEGSQILATIPQRHMRGAANGAAIYDSQSGITLELNHVEAPSKVYPTTAAFLSLLVALLGGSDGLDQATAPSSAVRKPEENRLRTIPENLGVPHRNPAYGVDSYTRFVVDDVLLRLDHREYKSADERWRLNERCLAYLDHALATFDFGALLDVVENPGDTSERQTAIAKLTVHPAFDILVRLLSASPLLENLLKTCSVDIEVLDDEKASSTSFLHCVLRGLRIIIRVCTIQQAFLDVVVPTVLESPGGVPSEKVGQLRSLQTIDQHLLYNSQVVVKIAVMVNCYRSKQIGLAAIRILGFLAESTTFSVTDMFRDVYKTKMNRLAGLIDASNETDRVLDGFVMRLSRPSDFSDTVFGRRVATLPESSIDEATRSAILDLLLRNTQPHSNAPNLAHLLLGYDIRQSSGKVELEDASSHTPPSCLHTVLAFLARIDADKARRSVPSDVPNLLEHAPILAEKCFRLIRQLCLHDYSAASATKYLRSSVDLFQHQASQLPMRVLQSDSENTGNITQSDGSVTESTAEGVISTLESQAWILECLALELSSLVTSEESEAAVRLLTSLYGINEALFAEDGESTLDSRSGPSQGLPRMLDVFYSLDFSWVDPLPLNETPLSMLANIPFDTCIRTQPTGCEIYDIDSVLALVAMAKSRFLQLGASAAQAQQDKFKHEVQALLQNLVIENNRREIQFARYHALRAWRNVLDITLTRAFQYLPSSGTDGLLLDILGSILPPIAADDADPAIQEIFAGAALNLMAEIRQQGLASSITTTHSPQFFATDRLIPILQALLRGIVQPGLDGVTRGNLYAALLQYIQHCAPKKAQSVDASSSLKDKMATSGLHQPASSVTLYAARSSQDEALQKANASSLLQYLDKLLLVVSLDATANHAVWQTVSFTVLDAVSTVIQASRNEARVVSTLTKHGYLQAFLSSLKESEAELLDILRTDPDSLNPLYAYEAKMSFLTRIAAYPGGAQKLMDMKTLGKLANCSFIGARPRGVEEAIDFDTFLPPVMQRYDQLLSPVLQLAVALATTSAVQREEVASQVKMFLGEHQETFRAILEDTTRTPLLGNLRQAHLLVQLMRTALPSVTGDDKTSSRSVSLLHTAILSLSGRVLAEQDFVASIQPSSDDELRNADELIPGMRRPISRFEAELTKVIEDLQLALLEYFRQHTSRPVFQPLWLPIFELDAASQAQNRGLAPTLRGAFSYILDTADALHERLAEHQELHRSLSNLDELNSSELAVYVGHLEHTSLDITSRRRLASGIMLDLQARVRSSITTSLYLGEMALLLLWRHLVHYIEDNGSRNIGAERPDARATHMLRSGLDSRHLKSNALKAFSLVCERLENLHLVEAISQSDARSHEALIGSLLRSTSSVLNDQE